MESTKQKMITVTYAEESHKYFNTNPAGSHKPSSSALGPLASDSYGEEMPFSENLGRSADSSELLNKKIRTQTFVQKNQKSIFFFLHKKFEGAQSFNKLRSQVQSTQKDSSGRKFKACNTGAH